MEKGVLLGQGRTAEVYAWGADRAVKLYRAGMPAELVEREYRLARGLQAAGVPAPFADGLIELDGRPGIVFERLSGPTLVQVLSSQPWRLAEAARLLGELHARIHQAALDVDLPIQRQELEWAIENQNVLPPESTRAALAKLAGLPDEDCLCHGDFHPDNVVLTPRGPLVIDWLTAVRGSPAGDLCRTRMILQTSGLPPGASRALRLLVEFLRGWLDRLYLRRYHRLHPTQPAEIAAWRLPVLAARLREVQGYPAEQRRLLAAIQRELEH